MYDCYIIFFLHVFLQTFKRDICELTDELLTSLDLIPDFLSEAKSANTVKKYYYCFRHLKSWATTHNI